MRLLKIVAYRGRLTIAVLPSCLMLTLGKMGPGNTSALGNTPALGKTWGKDRNIMQRIDKKKIGGLGLLITLLLAAITPANAQLSRNNKAPIDITAAKFEADDKNNYGIWTGDVQVVQGEVLMTAPKLVIYGINEGKTDRIEASGGMRYTNGIEAITGDNGIYDATQETITVTGNVIVVQGEQVMTGGKLIYNIKSGEMAFSGGNNKGRVRGIFKTGAQKSSASAS